MELLRQVSNTQLLFPAAAVAVVLICATFVFIFGFRSAEQPQFDKLPLVVDDRKSSNKKRKAKDKKSPNRTSSDEGKQKADGTKKSPTKEKKEEKVKEEKPKPKPEPKLVKKEVVEAKKAKKKNAVDLEKPADFDDGLWEEVPKKSEKKKVVKEEKKDSPSKKNKKKSKETELNGSVSAEEIVEPIKVETVYAAPEVDPEAELALMKQVQELQRVLKEVELREQAALGSTDEDSSPASEELTDIKDLRTRPNNKKENKQKKQKANEVANATKNATKPDPADGDKITAADNEETKANVPVFDELGDTWTEAKVPKKTKKKARKD